MADDQGSDNPHKVIQLGALPRSAKPQSGRFDSSLCDHMKRYLLAAVAALFVSGCSAVNQQHLTSKYLADRFEGYELCYDGPVYGIHFYKHPDVKMCAKKERLEKEIAKMLHIANDIKEFKDLKGNKFPKVDPEKHFPKTIIFTPYQPTSGHNKVNGFMSHKYNMAAVWCGWRCWGSISTVRHEIWHSVLFKTGWMTKTEWQYNRFGKKVPVKVPYGDYCHESITWSVGDPFYEECRPECGGCEKDEFGFVKRTRRWYR